MDIQQLLIACILRLEVHSHCSGTDPGRNPSGHGKNTIQNCEHLHFSEPGAERASLTTRGRKNIVPDNILSGFPDGFDPDAYLRSVHESSRSTIKQ